MPLQNLGPWRSRRIQHHRDDARVVRSKVLLIPTFNGSIDKPLGRVDPLTTGAGIEHVLLVRLFSIANVEDSLKMGRFVSTRIIFGVLNDLAYVNVSGDIDLLVKYFLMRHS